MLKKPKEEKMKKLVLIRGIDVDSDAEDQAVRKSAREGGTLNVEVIRTLVGFFFWKNSKNTKILILNP